MRVSMAGGWIPACAGKANYCGDIEMREASAAPWPKEKPERDVGGG